jgi:thiol-disulfide isomerase/thioredoxin
MKSLPSSRKAARLVALLLSVIPFLNIRASFGFRYSVTCLLRILGVEETSVKIPFLRSFAVLSVCLGLILLLSNCSTGKKEPALTLAPDFTLKTLDGQEITLSKLKGKAVLLDFWATWCGPCRESIPHLIQIYKMNQSNGLEVIGMSLDKGDADTVRNFAKSMEIPYPIAIASEEIARSYGVTSLPTAIFIDKEGKIREKFIGFSSAIANMIAARAADLTSEKL